MHGCHRSLPSASNLDGYDQPSTGAKRAQYLEGIPAKRFDPNGDSSYRQRGRWPSTGTSNADEVVRDSSSIGSKGHSLASDAADVPSPPYYSSDSAASRDTSVAGVFSSGANLDKNGDNYPTVASSSGIADVLEN